MSSVFAETSKSSDYASGCLEQFEGITRQVCQWPCGPDACRFPQRSSVGNARTRVHTELNRFRQRRLAKYLTQQAKHGGTGGTGTGTSEIIGLVEFLLNARTATRGKPLQNGATHQRESNPECLPQLVVPRFEQGRLKRCRGKPQQILLAVGSRRHGHRPPYGPAIACRFPVALFRQPGASFMQRKGAGLPPQWRLLSQRGRDRSVPTRAWPDRRLPPGSTAPCCDGTAS